MRFISCFLLIGFLGFLVPINNWHELAHKHSSKHTKSHTDGLTFKQGVEKCTFCDLQLPLLYHETVSIEVNWKTSFDFLFIDYTSCELPVKDTSLSLRGPPLNKLF